MEGASALCKVGDLNIPRRYISGESVVNPPPERLAPREWP
jgi:hypothetical protein